MYKSFVRWGLALLACASLLAACGGGDPKVNLLPGDNGGAVVPGGGGGDGSGPPPVLYTLSGTASGLEDGNTLTLQINGMAEATLAQDGSYSYTVSLPAGSVPANTTYTVAVKKQPFWQWCTVANGSGTAGDIGAINISCVAAAALVETLPSTTGTQTPYGLTGDGKGTLWFSDAAQQKIGRVAADGSGTVTWVAGTGAFGFVDNVPGNEAQFKNPYGVALDHQGNLLVADMINFRIRSIAPDASSTVSTLAGNGTNGIEDGTATQASFEQPFGLTVNPAGDIFVADRSASTIRKISMANGTRTVSLFAGVSDVYGGADSTPDTSATFNHPWGIAADAKGNVFVTEIYGYKVRKIDSNGWVTTVAGSGNAAFADGTGTSASFANPTGIAVDAAGNLYVADQYNYRLRRITPAGVVSTLAGSFNAGLKDGYGDQAEFANANSVYINDQGVIWMADYIGGGGHGAIRRITPVDPATVTVPPLCACA